MPWLVEPEPRNGDPIEESEDIFDNEKLLPTEVRAFNYNAVIIDISL